MRSYIESILEEKIDETIRDKLVQTRVNAILNTAEFSVLKLTNDGLSVREINKLLGLIPSDRAKVILSSAKKKIKHHKIRTYITRLKGEPIKFKLPSMIKYELKLVEELK